MTWGKYGHPKVDPIAKSSKCKSLRLQSIAILYIAIPYHIVQYHIEYHATYGNTVPYIPQVDNLLTAGYTVQSHAHHKLTTC
jgi:hypothetical protein